jgi:hypothetical protein
MIETSLPLLGFGVISRSGAVRTQCFRDRGPANNQIISPSKGRIRINTIQKTFAPVELGLSNVFTMAQISAIRIISPRMPPTSIPIFSSFDFTISILTIRFI